MLFRKLLLLGIIFFMCAPLSSQELQLLKRSDFDLKGPVQKCVVITSYGQELYEFNENGYLLSAETVFGKKDTETTYYKYNKDKIIEKRFEVYTQGVLDKNTSLASFYTYDKLPQSRVKEKIMNYNRKFIDQFIYRYDSIGRLFQEVNTNTQGRYIVDITYIENPAKNTKTTLFTTDSLTVKRIDSFFKPRSLVLEKLFVAEYEDGLLKNESRTVFNTKGKPIKLQELIYKKKDSVSVISTDISYSYEYNSWGAPNKTTIKRGVATQTKNIIYQLDGSIYKNWVKKITKPDNSYITRKITYFK